MHDLPAGMDAGIGPASTNHTGGCAGNGAQRGLECILHGTAARLALPAAKRCPAVLETEGDPGHHGTLPDTDEER